ncbi:MAG: hypothetical protein RSF40_01870 [Oscillospiraceae bacterium]
MVLERQKTYMVLNYSSSPVSLSTRERSYLLEGGTRDHPAVIPMTIDEIGTANTNGCAFKYGLAWFEKDFEEAIYEDIRLTNWRDILRDEQIEDIILHPTKEGLEKIVAINHEIYFNRVYGVYMGLKSVFAEISPRVELVIEQRRDELKANQRKTEIVISKPTPKVGTTGEDVEDLKARLAKMEELLSKQAVAQEVKSVESKPETNATNKPKGRPTSKT